MSMVDSCSAEEMSRFHYLTQHLLQILMRQQNRNSNVFSVNCLLNGSEMLKKSAQTRSQESVEKLNSGISPLLYVPVLGRSSISSKLFISQNTSSLYAPSSAIPPHYYIQQIQSHLKPSSMMMDEAQTHREARQV